MHRVAQRAFSNAYQARSSAAHKLGLPLSRSLFPGCVCHGARSLATEVSRAVPHLTAADLSYAQQPRHIREVFERLEQKGILKISLGFQDDKSQYLEKLIVSLHENHGHELPISHSASRGWFWDVRPTSTNFQTENHQARSETMDEFPWHTDCSYENPPPRYFALQVLQPDRFGGGTLSVMNVELLGELLTPSTRESLLRPEFRITIPPEFIKDPNQRHIIGSLLAADKQGRPSVMRFRGEILTPLTERATHALDELKHALQQLEAQSHSTVHLTPQELPARSIILVDNRRWLHARNDIKDPDRHLRRVRWDAIPFPSVTN